MSRRKNIGKSEQADEIDLTPMLDVVFIMLIFFIVTASFLKESSLPISQPDSDKNENAQPNPDTLLLHISSDDSITVEGRQIDARAIRAVVERHVAEFPGAAVVVQAHREASTGQYVAIADAARQAGVAQVALAMAKEKS